MIGVERQLQQLRLPAQGFLRLPLRLLPVVRCGLLPAASVELGHDGEKPAHEHEEDEADEV